MQENADIIELIDSLSQNEKAYISKFFLKNINKDSDYIKLYNFLCKNRTLDAKKIKKIFSESNISKNIPSSINYLYNQILDILSPISEKNNNEVKAFQFINQIYFLNRKSLYKQASKKIKSAKQLFSKFEMNELLLLCIQIEIDLLPYLKSSLLEKQTLIQEKIKVNKQIETENIALQHVNKSENLVFDFGISTRSNDKSSVNELRESLKLLLIQEPASLKSKHYIYHAFSNISIVENNYSEAYCYLKNIIELYNNNPHFKEHYIGLYIKLLCNYINRMVSASRFDELNEIDNLINEITSLKKIQQIDKTIIEDVYITYYHAKYSYFLEINQFEEAYKMATSMKAYSLPLKKNKSLDIIYHYDYMCVAFYNNKFTESLDISNYILNHKNKNAFSDLFIFTKIIQLFNWYALDETTLLLNNISTLRKQLQQVNYDATFEKYIIKMLFKLSNTTNINTKLNILNSTLESTTKWINHYPSAQMFFKINWWIDKENRSLKYNK